jgi:hypothetical protein
LTTRKFIRYFVRVTQIEQLLAVLHTYATAKGLAEATVSSRFLARGARAADLAGGGDMGSRTITKAIERFAREWPVGTVWPEGVAWPERVTRPDATTTGHRARPPRRPSPVAHESEAPSLAQHSRAALAQQLDDARVRLVRQRVAGRPAEHPYEDEDGAA